MDYVTIAHPDIEVTATCLPVQLAYYESKGWHVVESEEPTDQGVNEDG